MRRPDTAAGTADSDPPMSERIGGSDDAPVTLVQYGDFECPDCGDVTPVIEELRERLGADLQYVHYHAPRTETYARRTAETAGTQDACWSELGPDTGRFAATLCGHGYEARVHEGIESECENGVNATPTFFINGERYEGRHTLDALLAALVDAGDLSIARPIADGGSADDLRETIERSERGAPAAGSAVRDRFSSDEIFQRVIATADEEFSQGKRLLFLSGLAAGFAMSLSFVGVAALTALLSGDGGSTTAVGYLLYPLGFIFTVLGSYQLFTENTLTPVTLVMTRIASIPALLRIWGVVFGANVLGVAASAYVLANTGVFSPAAMAAASEIGRHFFELSWADIFWKGVFAGVLIAGMVWLIHAARDTAARVLLVFTLTYAVGAAELAHCIVGSAETLFVVFNGGESLWSFLTHFLAPATLGNTVGGVVFVAILNYSQTRDRRIRNRDCQALELDWSEWLFGNHIGRPTMPTAANEDETNAD